MSVLRAILGRLARFLVRIARTLDPGVAPAPYWAMPERMAALRLRYPGAPEHWLELLARRTSGAEGAPAPAHRPEPEARRDAPRPRFGTAEPAARRPPLGGDSARPTARPAPRFPAWTRTARVVARPGVADTAARPVAAAPRDAPRRLRPLLTFGAARVRNPIANLLRGRPANERPAAPRFPFDDGAPPQRAAREQPAARDGSRREHPPTFPGPDAHAPHQVEWIGPRQPRAEQREADPGWPEFRYSTPPGPSWPADSSRRARHNPRFAEPDNRWPELPPFLDESGAPVLRASDEAALLAEQIGGKWSE